MITLNKLRHYLDKLFPNDKVIDYAPNGLQVEGKQQISCIATAVSVTEETIEQAIEKGCDALIVHHGLFWQRDSYVIEGSKKKKLSLLFEAGISLFAYHLPLDMHPQIGNNWKAALDLGWRNLSPFGFSNGLFIGVKGEIAPCSFEHFLKTLENYYEHPAHAVSGGPSMIRKVGLISGGAHKSILEAAKENLDAFVTGSFDEPTWYQAKEEQIHFFALGHSATERVGPKALAAHLMKELDIPSFFLDVENPF